MLTVIQTIKNSDNKNDQGNYTYQGKKEEVNGALASLGYRFSDLGLIVSLDSGYEKTKNYEATHQKSYFCISRAPT